jgi:diketogulonate reductase-like aldo/keto reductase
MKQRPLGKTGRSISVIGEGTWNMEGDDRQGAVRSIRRAIDLGATHVDTAELYGSGSVERLVGEAIAGRRSDVFLVSKVLPHNASRRGTVAACERSLERLGTDYLDCYLLHWPGDHPLEDTIAAFDELVRAGKIRSFGVSNFDAAELRKAVRVAGEGRIAQNQVLYHLLERRIEHDVVPACEEAGVTVVAYSPFGSGDFPPPTSAGGRVLSSVARAHDATPRQVALAFLVRRQSVVAIPKASDVAHVEDNVRAASLRLSDEDIAGIDAAFPVGPRRRGVPML